MNLDRLREVSGFLGDALRQALIELEKNGEVVGGGFRHGEVEWQVRYEWNGLDRILFLSLGEASPSLLHLEIRAGATDSAGRWAYVPVASTTLPEEDAEDQLGAVVREMLERGRNILNAFGKEDLRPLVDSSFGDDTDSVLQSRSENEYPVFGEAMAPPETITKTKLTCSKERPRPIAGAAPTMRQGLRQDRCPFRGRYRAGSARAGGQDTL